MMNAEGFRSKGEFPDLYKDFIRTEGAPSILRRDNANEEGSAKVIAINRDLFVKDEFSEPYYPNQNPVESRMIRYIKQSTHTLMDITGAPEVAWFYAITYICEIHNRTADLKLPGCITPYQMRHGVTPDISAYLLFTFWEPILFLDLEEKWPYTRERPGRWLGVAHNVGDALTFYILDDQSKQVFARSVVRPFNKNKRIIWDPDFNVSNMVAQQGGDTETPTVSDAASDANEPKEPPVPDAISDVNNPSGQQNIPSRGTDLTFDPQDGKKVKVHEQDTYKGDSILRFANHKIPMNKDIPYVPRRKKERMCDTKYEGLVVDIPETPERVEVEMKKEGGQVEEHEADDKDSGIPKVKMKEPRRSARLQENSKTRSNKVFNALRSAHTIWVPSSMLRKRRKWALTNSIAAIPRYFFGTEQLLREAEACSEGEQMLTNDTMEQLRRYHLQLEYLERLGNRDDPDINWKVEDILDHTVRQHKGITRVFFKVKWRGGDTQWINMDDVRVHDPVAVIKYGEKENLLRTHGWEWIQAFLPMEEEVLLMTSAMNAATKDGHKYKFGIRVPSSVKEALALDRVNGNSFWEDAIRTELKQICEYDTFHVVEDGIYLPGYKRIPYHIVYNVKFDL